MIDRKALWFSITVILAMVAASFWRLSLLPDWHHMPLDGPGSSHSINGLVLFIQPFGATFATVNFYARKYFATGADEAVRPWRYWGTMFVIAFCIVVGLMEAFIITHSLGYGLALNRSTIARIGIAATGILMLAAGNALPKLPWLSMRLRWFQLDPWQQNRHLRFQGKLMVGLGLFLLLFAIGLPLLPPKLGLPLMLGLCLTVVTASLWYRAKLRREPSPMP